MPRHTRHKPVSPRPRNCNRPPRNLETEQEGEAHPSWVGLPSRCQVTMHDCCQRMQNPTAGAGESKQGLHQTNMWYVNQDWCDSHGGKRGQQERNVNPGSGRHPELHQGPIRADVNFHFTPVTKSERMLQKRGTTVNGFARQRSRYLDLRLHQWHILKVRNFEQTLRIPVIRLLPL